MYSHVTQDIQIQVEPIYVAAQSRPDQNYFFFAYKVQIKNLGKISVQLLSRYWVIVDGEGHTEEVRGPGVVGQQPHIEEGQTYEYTSFCPLPTPTGNMRGSYLMTNEKGERFDAKIPLFFFRVPEMLH